MSHAVLGIEADWEFYDRQQLHPMLRRRKLIGRRPIDIVRGGKEVSRLLPIKYGDLLWRTAGAFAWLCDCDGSDVPSHWSAWETQNDCIYLTPTESQSWRLHRADRRFDETLSSDGAGLCATEVAVNRLSTELCIPELPIVCSDSRVVRLARRLADYRGMHPEHRKVAAVLD